MSNLHLRASAAKTVIEIERPIGPALFNRAADLHAVRNALARRGICRRAIRDLTGAAYKPDLAAAIRTFQRRRGLEIDGVVLPGGPTEQAFGESGDVAARPPADEEPKIGTECERIADAVDEIDRETIRLAAKIGRLSARMAQLRARIDATSNEQEARRLRRELDDTQREWLEANTDFINSQTRRIGFVRRYANLACPVVVGFRLPPAPR